MENEQIPKYRMSCTPSFVPKEQGEETFSRKRYRALVYNMWLQKVKGEHPIRCSNTTRLSVCFLERPDSCRRNDSLVAELKGSTLLMPSV